MPILGWYGLIAVLIFGAGAATSWKVVSDHYEAKEMKSTKVELEHFETAVLGMNQLSAALEESRREKRITYRTIEKRIPEIISRDVVRYNSDCLTDDGLQLINEALAGRLHTGEPSKSVPAAEPAGK